MKKSRIFNRVFCALISIMLVSGTVTPVAALSESGVGITEDSSFQKSGYEYDDYLAGLADESFAEGEIKLDISTITGSLKTTEKDGVKCFELNSENNLVEFTFNVPTSALYNISVTYCDLLNDDLYLKAGFYFDRELPYVELENIIFSKIWESETDEEGNVIQKDEFGNEIRPTEKAKQRFNTEWVESDTGRYREPYAVFLTAGTHTLTVKNVLGSMLISEIALKVYTEPISYDEYITEYSSFDSKGEQRYLIEAENSFEVSDSTLAATINSTNAGMSPSSSTLKVVNSFGQNYWNSNGQWGSWVVPDDVQKGLYSVSFRAKQTGSVGVSSYRSLYINGKVPFKEAQNIAFEYNSKWQIKTIGDEQPYFVYLEPGDIITLKATTGEMADVVNKIFTAIDELNVIYQSIIIVTGTSPDEKRDYNIQKEIPTLLDDIAAVREQINEIAEDISAIMGETNSKVYFMRRFVALLDGFTENYRTIVPELNSFKDYIDSLASQTYDFNSMPLELDWISLSKADAEPKKANAGWWESLTFEIQRFVYTFASEYGADRATSDNKTDAVTVWCSLGRDQAQAVKSIIENDFVPKTGIAVDFKMTSTSLSEAILAGREPDVALSVTQDVPVDLALRGQVLDLAPYLEKMSDEYMSQFNESSWIPFQYKEGIYAMPITQDYYMMFYREDILARLGIELPNTWDELYYVIRELQKSNFQVGIKEADSSSAGISSAINIFDMFLYQNGGTYFNDELTETLFESSEGKAAFKEWVSLYRDYRLDTDFNLLTRFRSGEMPIIITGYSFYQTVAATAPEISGRWQMACVPGTLKDDETIDRTETSTVTGAIVLMGAKNRGVADEAFEFISWWASSDVQLQYITAMESIQGIAGRLSTANKVTFESLNWTEKESEVLKSQRQWVTAVNQVPGTYIINRSLTNALRTSYASTAIDPLRQLNIQNSIINDEITRKRSEFEKNN